MGCIWTRKARENPAGYKAGTWGGISGGISGAGVTMRCSDIRRRAAADRQLAEDLSRLRRRISNNE
jgi:hypothetical protein